MLEKKIGPDPFCRFREKRKKHTLNFDKQRYRAEDWVTLTTS